MSAFPDGDTSYAPFQDHPLAGSAAILCTGGANVIRKEAWSFIRTSFGVRLCWELEEPEGPKNRGLSRELNATRKRRATLVEPFWYDLARRTPFETRCLLVDGPFWKCRVLFEIQIVLHLNFAVRIISVDNPGLKLSKFESCLQGSSPWPSPTRMALGLGPIELCSYQDANF